MRYLKQIETIYKDGFIEDLKSGRHISAIICGYGATFVDDYAQFAEAFRQSSVFQYYNPSVNGEL
jgi:hypothetical protein